MVIISECLMVPIDNGFRGYLMGKYALRRVSGVEEGIETE